MLSAMDSDVVAARQWLIVCALLGIAIVALFPGNYFEDPGIHFLRARWMWTHPSMVVDTWDRPLFTAVYSLPANLPLSSFSTYLAAKLATVVISLVTAWLTWKLARAYGLERPALVIPLLWLQPTVFLLSSQTTPEPLFMLLVVIALWLRRQGRLVAGLTTASFLTLVRPEGFLLLPMWAWWAVTDPRAPRSKGARMGVVFTLLVAPALWWYLAAQITTNALFPIHNWPPLFMSMASGFLGGGMENEFSRWGAVLGVILVVPFLVGVWATARRPDAKFAVGLLLLVFCAHLLWGASGVFGWAPVPSAYVCVAPIIALAVLDGWNAIARGLASLGHRRALLPMGAALLLIAAFGDFAFADTVPTSRDWQPIAGATQWFAAHGRPVTKFVWSQSYADVLLSRDPMENSLRFGDRSGALATFENATSGTLVLWDAQAGPSAYHLSSADVQRAGFVPMYRTSVAIQGWLPSDSGSRAMARVRALLQVPADSVRHEELWLLYRP